MHLITMVVPMVVTVLVAGGSMSSSGRRGNARRSSAQRTERIAASPRFNGRVFVNTGGMAINPLVSADSAVERPTMRDFLCGGERRVPTGAIPLVDPTAVWRTRATSGLRVTRIGHSTLLIEIDGVVVLTDPVWGARVSPLAFAGPRRFHAPPVRLSELPPLDAVLISHDHYDHLDRPTVRALARSAVPFITSLGVGAHLERWGVAPARITELDWWETTELRGLTVTAAPSQHFSGRGLRDRNSTLWSSFHLRGPNRSFFYGADSGLTAEYRTIGERLGPFDAVALEVGAYHPSWSSIHMGPVNALTAQQMLGSGALLPIHWSTFNLAMHPWDEPAETILRLAPASGVRLLMPRIGEPVEPALASEVEPWWRAVDAEGAAPVSNADTGGEDTPQTPLEWLPD